MKRLIILFIASLVTYQSFAQIGFGMVLKGDATSGVSIEKVGEKSGSELAGMQAGDVLISINGKSFAGKNYIEAAALLKEQPDKGNKLKFIRNGKEIEVVINKTLLQQMQGTTYCISGDCNNGKGKLQVKTSVNYIYEGDFKEGKRHGNGVQTYAEPYPNIKIANNPIGNLQLLKYTGTFNNNELGKGEMLIKTDKGNAKLAGAFDANYLLNGKYLYTSLPSNKKEYLVYENGIYVSNVQGADANKKNETTTVAKPTSSLLKKGSEIIWDVQDEGFSGFFKIVFTAVTTDSICFNWHVAEVTEPLQKGSVKMGKNVINNATKFESEFLQDDGKRFATLQNGVIFFLSNSVARQLIAKQEVDIQFLPDEKSKCKLYKANPNFPSPQKGHSLTTWITQYECEDEMATPFSFINNYNIPIVTSIIVKTASFTLMEIKL
jgi:membrane-associated protease RseP (regulator of RpoE activity)